VAAAQAATPVTPPPDVPGIRDRLKQGLGRLGSRRKQHGYRSAQGKTSPVVKGFVVPDEPVANGAGATSADPEDDTEPS
jgi:hypothetical protein